eukprot:m.24657 g.24657  ORF g.24657 m.24657 type:complete len:71 (-) comp8624_c0_seq3:1192-1404(-)
MQLRVRICIHVCTSTHLHIYMHTASRTQLHPHPHMFSRMPLATYSNLEISQFAVIKEHLQCLSHHSHAFA